MLVRIKNSFAFRSAILYKFLLKYAFKRNVITNKQIHGYRLITLCGKNHVDMLVQALNSLLHIWEEIPEIIIYSDGSLSETKLRDKLRVFLPTVFIKSFSTEQLPPNWSLLKKFAQDNVIGKKLALIALNAVEIPTIWFDTDILWFKSLNFKQEFSNRKGFFIKTTSDYQPAYSSNLTCSGLNSSPYINTGIVLMHGDLLSVEGVNELLLTATDSSDHFTEQTILACVSKQLQSDVFSLEEFACFQSDSLSIKSTFQGKSWIGRHYVGPVRHLFWRDAFFMQLQDKI